MEYICTLVAPDGFLMAFHVEADNEPEAWLVAKRKAGEATHKDDWKEFRIELGQLTEFGWREGLR